MTYKLLSTGRGVPVSFSPELGNVLKLKFENAADLSNVCVKTRNGDVFYREIYDGGCALNISAFAGEIELSVIAMDSTEKPSRWNCGSITVWHTLQGAMAAPALSDIAELTLNLMIEVEDLRHEYASTKEEVARLSERLNSIYDGYDII